MGAGTWGLITVASAPALFPGGWQRPWGLPGSERVSLSVGEIAHREGCIRRVTPGWQPRLCGLPHTPGPKAGHFEAPDAMEEWDRASDEEGGREPQVPVGFSKREMSSKTSSRVSPQDTLRSMATPPQAGKICVSHFPALCSFV